MSLAIYVGGVFFVVVVMLSSYFLGGRGAGRARCYPYESGIKAMGTTQVRFFAHYFLVAILFVIFDMESVLLYVWSSVVRETGWLGFFQVTFFVGMLLLALVYAISQGVLQMLPKITKSSEAKSK